MYPNSSYHFLLLYFILHSRSLQYILSDMLLNLVCYMISKNTTILAREFKLILDKTLIKESNR